MRAEGTMGAIDPERLRVHVITSSGLVPGRGHVEVAKAAVEGGADVVQLRARELSDDELLSVARQIVRSCRRTDVLFLVNDRIDIAIAAGAGGAHVGKGDHPETARERLGPRGVLGISVATPEQADAAARATGVAVVSAVGTAPDPVRATQELVEVVRAHASVPGV